MIRALLSVVPAWLWSALIVGGLAGAALLERQATIADLRTEVSAARHETTQARLETELARTDALAATLRDEQAQRAIERERARRAEERTRADEILAAERRRAAGALGAAVARVQQRARADAARIAAACLGDAGGDPAAAAEREAARAALDLQAELHGRLAAAARDLALFGDKSADAGGSCSELYDAVKDAAERRAPDGKAGRDTGAEPPSTQPDGAK